MREEICIRHSSAGRKRRNSLFSFGPEDLPPKTYYPYPYPGARPGVQDQGSRTTSTSTEAPAMPRLSDPVSSNSASDAEAVRRSSPDSAGPDSQSLGSEPPRPRKFPEAWARFPSHNRAERNADDESADPVTPEEPAFISRPIPETTQTAVSGDISDHHRNKVIGHRHKNSMSSKLGKALKSGLNKLVHSRRSSEVSWNDSHNDQARANLEYPELAIEPTEAGYRELEALGREIRRLKRSVPSDSEDVPTPWVFAGQRNLTTPGTAPTSRGRDSSATTDKFATPLSSPSLNDASFHSFPRSNSPESRRQSSAPILSKGVVPEIRVTDMSSVKSDTTLVLKAHQGKFADENGDGQINSATSGSSKYNTWSGPDDSQATDETKESDDEQMLPQNKRRSHANSLSIQELAAGHV